MALTHQFKKTVFFPASQVEAIFNYHTCIESICKLAPNYVKIKIIAAPVPLKLNGKVCLLVCLCGFPFLWKAKIIEYQQNVSFVDCSTLGPFSYWKHYHFFKSNKTGTLMTDCIKYSLPLGILGETADYLFVRGMLDKIFSARHKKALEYFANKARENKEIKL